MTTGASLLAAEAEPILVEQLRGGASAAQEAFVRGYAGPMLLSARRLLGQEASARAALQEAFAVAFKDLATLDAKTRLGPWLHRLIIKTALAHLRNQPAAVARTMDELLPRFLDSGCQTRSPETRRGSPLEKRALPADSECIRAAMKQLPDEYRTVLLLRDIEGLDTDAAAQLLDLKSAVVRMRLHRARQGLCSLLHSGAVP